MTGWLGAVSANTSIISMRSLLGQIPLFSLLSTASSSSYHDEAGVLDFVNPKIGTYGVTPNGNGGEQKFNERSFHGLMVNRNDTQRWYALWHDKVTTSDSLINGHFGD